MATPAVIEASARKRSPISEFVFLLQVSRPGLWSTTAMFYLIPLGHADLPRSRSSWLGLVNVLFPLGVSRGIGL